MSENPPETTICGHVSYKRVISDNVHGNVQCERTMPVLVTGPLTPQNVNDAEIAAWAAVVEQVNETINRQFEREGMAAPIHDGPRYTVARWAPDDSILLIVPQRSRPPGGIREHFLGRGRRLDDARRIAARLVQGDRSLADLVDFSHGDFTSLKVRLDDLHAEALILDPELDEPPEEEDNAF